MAKIKIPLTSVLVLLICFTLFSALLVTAGSPPENVSFTYGDHHDWKLSSLTLQGDIDFTWDGDLRLTKLDSDGVDGVPLTIGRVLYTEPISLWHNKSKASFNTTVEIFIQGNANDNIPQGDGLVFFITAVNSTPKSPGGSFGVFDESGKNPSLFAVELDTLPNEFDPPYPHVGIDIGSRISSNVSTEVNELRMGLVTANISYNAATNLISVRGVGLRSNVTFEVSYVSDLSSFLPQQVQVGVSAATGEVAASVYYLLYWSFTSYHI